MSNDPTTEEGRAWRPSVFYATSTVNCGLATAWKLMVDYQAWNPDFANAHIVRIGGQPAVEGEVNLIRLMDADDRLVTEFYSETVKVVSPLHMVWYVCPKEGNAFRNFVDFCLAEVPSGVRFTISYYAQNPLPAELLAEHRKQTEIALRSLASSFKNYCEGERK